MAKNASSSATTTASKPKPKPKASIPSSNWLALQKTLPRKRDRVDSSQDSDVPRKRRKLSPSSRETLDRDVPTKQKLTSVVKQTSIATSVKSKAGTVAGDATASDADPGMKNGESVAALRRMIRGEVEFTEVQSQPGKYLAMDCEMVGVGPEGAESSLARVSLVNFHGAVQLDVFVRQRERVVDYRTEFSGVRESDMVNAQPFTVIQTRVASLLKDRILIGHAVHNDLRALLLAHPHSATRDTQLYAHRAGTVKNKRVALRKLVEQELGVRIQEGEHSSVVDARATMAVWRLNRREWEKGAPRVSVKGRVGTKGDEGGGVGGGDAEDEDGDEEWEDDAGDDDDDGRDEDEDQEDRTALPRNNSNASKLKPAPKLATPSVPKHKPATAPQPKSQTKTKPSSFPGGGRKGVSSGLSTVVRHHQKQPRRGTRVEGGVRVRVSGGGGGADARGGKGEGGGAGQWWKELGGSKGSMRL
ncbi:ribonuclease H-like domain-containing protein [Mycena sanguinolenta]|nr:ribonuclease H-like domain-containing protein [Mycena sanguinolenta]